MSLINFDYDDIFNLSMENIAVGMLQAVHICAKNDLPGPTGPTGCCVSGHTGPRGESYIGELDDIKFDSSATELVFTFTAGIARVGVNSVTFI